MVLDHIVNTDGDKFVLLCSKTLGHTQDLLAKIQNILEYSREFQSLYGYYGENVAQSWTKSDIKFRFRNWRTGKLDNVRVFCRGMEQHIVGLNYLDQRPTLAILDDPEDTENTKTIERMENNYAVLKKNIVPGLDPQRGRIWVVGTPQKANGMVNRLENLSKDTGKLLEGSKGSTIYKGDWFSLRYKSTIDFENKEVLWKEWLSWEQLRSKYNEAYSDGKLSLYYSEYECEIVGDSDQVFLPEDFRFYKGSIETDSFGKSVLNLDGIGEKGKLKDVKEKIPVNIYIGCDLASSKRTTADYSVTLPIAYDSQGRIFVLPYFRKRVKPTEHAEQIFDMAYELRPDSTQVESIAYQEMMRDYLIKMCRESDFHISGIEIKYTFSDKKVDRLASLEHFFRNHKVYFLENMQDFESELLLFPRSKHDDIADAFYLATRRIRKPEHNMIASKIKKIFKRQPQNSWMARL
jgi:predicted phage terminase large subunit-like protein